MAQRITASEARRIMELRMRGPGLIPVLADVYGQIDKAAHLMQSQIQLGTVFVQQFMLALAEMQAIVVTLREDGYLVSQDGGTMTISWERAV